MPRVVRDSDEDAEPKTTRRTRASSAASSTATVTDSPARRNTRNTRQITTIESSPESLDDSNVQPKGRTTRSRAATLDKNAVTTAKNLRSRKNVNSPDLSDSVEVVEVETTNKRVTRKTATTVASTGTPTKTNARTRNLRAGSEVKSTPPSRSIRVTRASSVDPLGNLNESIGTPIKRRTRASIVPLEPTLTEEKEARDKGSSGLGDAVAEIDQDLEVSQESSKDKPTRKSLKSTKKIEKETNDGKSVIAIDETFNNSKLSESDSSTNIDKKMSKKYISIQTDLVEEPTMQLADKKVITSDSPLIEKKNDSREHNDSSSLNDNRLKSEHIANDQKIVIKKSKDIENEVIDVEGLTESALSDDEFVVMDSPCKSKNEVGIDVRTVNMKDAYVKLDRAEVVEKVICTQTDGKEIVTELKNSSDILSPNDGIKTAIVLVDDFVKNNENLTSKAHAFEKIFPLQDEPMDIETSESRSNGKDDSNLKVIEDEDDDASNMLLVDMEENNDVSSDSGIQTYTDNLISECKVKQNDNSKENETLNRSFMDEINDLENLITEGEKDTNKCDVSNVFTNENDEIPSNHNYDELDTNEATNETGSSTIVANENVDSLTFEDNHSKLNTLETDDDIGINQIENSKIIENQNETVLENLESENENEIEIICNKVEVSLTENCKKIVDTDQCEVISSITQSKTEETYVVSADSRNTDIIFDSATNENKKLSVVKSDDIPMEQDNTLKDNEEITSYCSKSNFVKERSEETMVPVEKNDNECKDSTLLAQLNDETRSTAIENETYDNDNIDNNVPNQSSQCNGESENSTAVVALNNDRSSLTRENKNCGASENVALTVEFNVDGDSSVKEKKNVECTTSFFKQSFTSENDRSKNDEVHAIPETLDNEVVISLELENIESVSLNLSDSEKANDNDEPEIYSYETQSDPLSLPNTDGYSAVENIKSDKTDTNKNAPEISAVDKNSVYSTVTDADGEDASTSKNLEKTNDKATASHKKVDEREQDENDDFDETEASLFQDIPAEEWSQTQTLDASKTVDESCLQESRIEASKMSRSLNKSREKSLNKSRETEPDQKLNDSLSKKTRKSLVKELDISQESAFTIQESNKTGIEVEELDSENKSPNKSRRSETKSPKANQDSKLNKSRSPAEKSLNNSSSSIKNRRSLEKSQHLNQSELEQNEISLNTSKTSRRASLANTSSRMSTVQEVGDEDEPMEVDEVSDEEVANDRSMNKSRKSLNDSRLNHSSRKSSNQGLKGDEEEVTSPSKAMKSVDEKINTESINKNRRSLNKSSSTPNKTKSLSEELSISLNDSKRSKSRLSGKLDDSSSKVSKRIEEQNDGSSDEHVEVDEELKNSVKYLGKSLDNEAIDQSEQIIVNADIGISPKNNNKSFKETSLRKSLNSSTDAPKVIVNGSTEIDEVAEEKIENKSMNKSLNTSSKSNKSAKNTPVKSPAKKSPRKTDENGDGTSKSSPEKSKKEVSLNQSLQKSIERMKYVNPPKHDLSTVAQDDSSSDDDSIELPTFIFRASDSDATKDSSDDEEEKDSDDEMDSDIAKEYNLAGKNRSKYSDDDVPGDDCRASEEEFSDSEDSGEDLQDFVVPDDIVDEDEDEDVDSEVEVDGDNDEEGESEVEVANAKDTKSKCEKDDSHSSTTEATFKNVNGNKSISIHSASESDVLETTNKAAAKRDKSLNKSKNLNASESNSVKDNSVNASKLRKSIDQSNSESGEEGSVRQNVNQVSMKDKSFDKSKSIKEKNSNKSYLSVSKLGNSEVLNQSKVSVKSKNVSFAQQNHDESSDSRAEEDETSEVNVQSSSESESEAGEDSYRIITISQTGTNQSKAKNKKLGPLMECSTPKSGVSTKTEFSKDNLSITANKSSSTRVKSSSLNDASISKNTSIVAQSASKSVSTPESVVKNPQPWKLIPFSQTINPSGNDTPTTKYLKKTKLNDSFPVLESMKSGDLAELKNTSKSRRSAPDSSGQVDEKSKKRKLQDMSNVQSIDDDSILLVTKKKKRARIEDSTILENDSQEKDIAEVKESKKKKNNNLASKETEKIEKVEKSKKTKKKSKVAEVVVVEEEANGEEENQENEVKKLKKKKSRKVEEQGELVVEEEKAKKKKKNKKKVANDDDDDDEAPESVGFEETRRSALTAMQQASDNMKAIKEARKKKHEERQTLKRLPDDLLENFSDEPQLRRPDKRQKLSRNRERNVVMPSKSMFSPGKVVPANLEVDDGYFPLSSTGSTTGFSIVNLQKVKKVGKKNIAVMNFRQKMLARNTRLPVASYLSIMKKQQAKGGK